MILIMEQDAINTIVLEHELWLAGNGGKRADLSNFDLYAVKLCKVNLSNANIRLSNLSGGYLMNSVFDGADMSVTRLCNANLRGSSFKGVSFRWADFSRADLRYADLTNADFTHACLNGAVGPFVTGYFQGGHNAIAAGGYISIGCERHNYKHWRMFGGQIGRKNGYSSDLIDVYSSWIDLAIKTLEGPEYLAELKMNS